MHFQQFLKIIIERISQKFQAHWVFRLKPQKLNAGFVKFFEKYAKIRRF